MIEGETLLSGASETCCECGETVRLGVYLSAAGYYVGTRCRCGPYTRESGYYATEREASEALAEGSYRRDSGYVRAPLRRI